MQTKIVRRWFLSRYAMQKPRTTGCSSGVPDDSATAHGETSGGVRWRHACVAVLVAVFAGFAALPAYGDAPIDFKYPFGDSRGMEVVLISSVSVIPPKEGSGEPKKGETGTKLRVTIKEGKGYAEAAGGYKFFQVLDGTNKSYLDTDSAQTAVRWSTEGKADVGHDTNAQGQGVRGSSAAWTQGNKTAPNQDAYWETDIPTDATHVEVVLVYTDILYNTNAYRKGTGAQFNGDMPCVIGSSSGDRQADGTWTFTAHNTGNNPDVFQKQGDYPTNAEITAGTTAAQTTVLTKTGYTLQTRPATLADTKNIPITNGPAIEAAIDAAVTNTQINPPPGTHARSHDTGFDILRR